MSDDDDQFSREEQAFRASFAETEEFEPLDPAQFRAPAKPRILWGRVIGAAAAAVVVVAGAGFGLSQLAGRGMPATVAAAASTVEPGVVVNDKGEGTGGGALVPSPQLPSEPNLGSSAQHWQTTSKPPLIRFDPGTGWLDGRFYLAGGPACGPTADCVAGDVDAAYDPSTDTWARIAAAPVMLAGSRGVAFEGKLYFTVGESGTSSLLVSYDPSTDSWSRVSTPARLGGLVVAGDQLIGVGLGTRLGGDAIDRRYDPSNNTWSALPVAPYSPAGARSVVAAGGHLVLSASTLSGEWNYATFDLATQTWTAQGKLSASGQPVAVGDSVVWFATDDAGKPSSIGGVYEVSTSSWRMYSIDLQPGTLDDTGTVVGNRVTYFGHLLSPATAGTSALPDLPKAKLADQTVIGSPDGLLVYRLTGFGTKVKATAYYLPVSP